MPRQQQPCPRDRKSLRKERSIVILKSGVPNEQSLRDEIRRVLDRCDRNVITHKMLRRIIERRLRLEPKVLDKIKGRVCDYAELFSEQLVADAESGNKRPRSWESENAIEAGGGRSSSA